MSFSAAKVALLATFALVARLSAATAFAQANEQIVEKFFPQLLIDKSVADHAAGGPRPFRTSAHAAGDLNNDGSSFIVAAYSNGFGGSVRVLQQNGDDFALVYESDRELMGGDFPEVEFKDLDNDRRPEIIVSFCLPAEGHGRRGFLNGQK